MGAALFVAMRAVDAVLATHGATRWAALAGLVVLGLAVYGGAGIVLRAFAPRELARMLRRPAS